MLDRADGRFLGKLAAVSAVVVLAVLLLTRGASRQLGVERRIAELGRIARRSEVPLEALVALCIAEARRRDPRPDAAVAARLAAAWRRHRPSEEDALRSLFADEVEGRMAVDLLRSNRARWRRIAR